MRDLHGRRVGDAQSVFELRLDTEPPEHLIDLGTAAVDEYGIYADYLQCGDVLEYRFGYLVVAHGVAAVLDDYGFARILMYIGQGFADYLCAFYGRLV